MMKETCIPDSDRKHTPGTIVLIHAEWGGDNTPHVIVEWNGDRGFIKPVEWPHGTVIPCELVTAEMIQPAIQH
jgi:hypothetical protein